MAENRKQEKTQFGSYNLPRGTSAFPRAVPWTRVIVVGLEQSPSVMMFFDFPLPFPKLAMQVLARRQSERG